LYVSCIWIWQSRALNHSLAAVPRRLCVEINLEPAGSDRQKRRVRWLFMPRRYRAVVCLTVTVREEWRRQKAVVNFAHAIIYFIRRHRRAAKTRRHLVRIDILLTFGFGLKRYRWCAKEYDKLLWFQDEDPPHASRNARDLDAEYYYNILTIRNETCV